MSFEKVKEYLKQFSLDDRIIQFPSSSATVELAAIALGCSPSRIAKTMSFSASDTVLIVTAGDMKIDNSKYKDFFKVKAKMLSFDELEEKVGHPGGGVCPFAVNSDVKVYLDISLKRFDTVFPACGSINSAIELTIPELEKCSNYISWIDVCKQK